MLIEATVKCDVDRTPYRIYINDELITERLYTITSDVTVSNNLNVQLVDTETYDIKVQSLTDNEVRLVDYNIIKIGKTT